MLHELCSETSYAVRQTADTDWRLLGSAGSSGGSGAALAARLTPLATCEDTGRAPEAVLAEA